MTEREPCRYDGCGGDITDPRACDCLYPCRAYGAGDQDEANGLA